MLSMVFLSWVTFIHSFVALRLWRETVLLCAHSAEGNLCNLVDRKRLRETKKGMALTPLRRCSFHVFVAYRVYSPIRLAVSMETRGKTYRFSLWTPLKENSFKNPSVPFRSSLILAESFSSSPRRSFFLSHRLTWFPSVFRKRWRARKKREERKEEKGEEEEEEEERKAESGSAVKRGLFR